MRTGDSIGSWTVVDSGMAEDKALTHLAECKCGNTLVVTRNQLLKSKTGLCRQCWEKSVVKVSLDDVFGGWTVLEKAPTDKWGKTRWVCQCECGTQKEVMSASLLSGKSSRCHRCAALRWMK